MVGFQGDEGKKIDGSKVTVSTISAQEFRSSFNLLLNPEQYQKEILQESKQFEIVHPEQP